MENKEEVKNETVMPKLDENNEVNNTAKEDNNTIKEPENNKEANNGENEIKTQEIPEKAKKIVNPDAFNSDERVLYEIKEEKQGSPIIVLILFILLAIFILNLPTINKFVQEKFGHTFTRTPVVDSSNTGTTQNNTTETNKFHDASNRVKIGELDVFQVDTVNQDDEYFTTFTITNNGNTTYTYDKKYYLVLYEDDRALYRALIHSYDALASHASAELKLVINKNAYDKANNFKIEEINTSLYEEKQLTKQEDDYMVLTCKYRNDDINYYFKDNMLEKIEENYSVPITDPAYEALYQEYSTKSQSYNEMNGIESVFIGRQDSFEVENKFSLSEIQEIDLRNLKVYRYFQYSTNSKIVAFEMTSMGYTCS